MSVKEFAIRRFTPSSAAPTDLRKAAFIVLCITMLVCSVAFLFITCHRCSCWSTPTPQLMQRILSVRSELYSPPTQHNHGNLILITKSQKRFPKAIIIGVKKCGTRALLEFIRLHPDVRAPGPETHFFDRNYHLGFDWYRDRMPTTLDGQLTMEKTPSYYITAAAAQRIHAFNPRMKLIVVVRDPVTRAISDYTQSLTKRPDLPSFEQMVLANNGSISDKWNAVRLGVYASFLSEWLKYFSQSQLHFVSGEQLISNPAAALFDVQNFLRLKPVVGVRHFYFNQTKGFPCIKKPVGSPNPRCLGSSKGRTHPIVEPAVLTKLRNYYKAHNERFYTLVGKRFDW